MRRSTSYYDVLNVSQDATLGDIRKAYHRLALIYHPDKQKNVDKDTWHRILLAYKVLSSSHDRALYDKYGPSLNYRNPETIIQSLAPLFTFTTIGFINGLIYPQGLTLLILEIPAGIMLYKRFKKTKSRSDIITIAILALPVGTLAGVVACKICTQTLYFMSS